MEARMEATTGSNARALLRAGVVVGPFYLGLGLAQALLREGFDLGRHPLSLLADGPGGWVQTANFVISGLLVIVAAMGIREALRPQSRAAGWILAVFGVSMLVAAVFRADPMDGFPGGTPKGMPATLSTSGMVHFMAAGLGFLALAVSCFLVGVAMVRRRERGWVGFSFFAGASVIGGFIGPGLIPASGPVAGIWYAVVMGFAWLALISLHLSRAKG
jgi:hypothetical protein